MTAHRPPPDPTLPMRVPPRPPLPAPPTEPLPVTERMPAPGYDATVEPDATTLPLPVVAATPAVAAPVATATAGSTATVPAPADVAALAPAPQADDPSAAPRARRQKPKRRHRGLRITLGVGIPVVVVAALAAVGWVGGNAWAHNAVVDHVTQETRQALNLPASHTVDVTVADPVLPQLVEGALTSLTVHVPDAPLGGGSADVTLHATGVPVRGDGPARSATAEIGMPTADLTRLAGGLGRTVPGSLRVEHGDVVVSLDPSQFLSDVSFALTLRPSVSGGALVLTPTGFDVGGLSMPADVIRDRFGALAPGILAPRTVCVATAFPRGMTLTALTLGPQQTTASFRVDPRMLSDTALQKPGVCR